MIEQHQCELLENSDAVLYKDEDQWVLRLYKTATPEDLESNHYLEEEGDIIEQVTVPVQFCPYCGEKLGGSVTEPGYHYHDFSRW